jgi:hypothetical protein
MTAVPAVLVAWAERAGESFVSPACAFAAAERMKPLTTVSTLSLNSIPTAVPKLHFRSD